MSNIATFAPGDQVFIPLCMYRGQKTLNETFKVLAPLQENKRGWQITVDGSHVFGEDYFRIRVTVPSPEGVVHVDSEAAAEVVREKEEASARDSSPELDHVDRERIEEIQDKYEVLKDLTCSIAQNNIFSLIVRGSAGTGKTYTVEDTLRSYKDDKDSKMEYEFCSGFTTPIALYQILWHNRRKNKVTVFDDNDSIFTEETALNLLKAALDIRPVRTLKYSAESKVLAREDIPDSFDFEGKIIFLTNVDLQRETNRASKIGKHMEALVSRSHYLDLSLRTQRDKYLRLVQLTEEGVLFGRYKFSSEVEQAILHFVFENRDSLREFSLRTAIKVADLVRMSPKGWERLARASLLKV